MKLVRIEPIVQVLRRFAALPFDQQVLVLEQLDETSEYAYRTIKKALKDYGDLPLNTRGKL